MTRFIYICAFLYLQQCLAINPEQLSQDKSKQLGFGNVSLNGNLRGISRGMPSNEADAIEDGAGVARPCNHCGHYCGGHCQGGGNNMNVALVPDQSSNPSTGVRATEKDCEEDPTADEILINGVVNDHESAKKSEDVGREQAASNKAEEQTARAAKTRDQAALDDQAYSIEMRLEDFEDADDSDVADLESKDMEDAKEGQKYSVEESLEDLNDEESIDEEKPPAIANEVSESLDVINQAENSISEDIQPVVTPDAPKTQEVFCDEVTDQANKAAKLKSEIKKESDDLKLEEAKHKLETESSAAEAAMSKERSHLADE